MELNFIQRKLLHVGSISGSYSTSLRIGSTRRSMSLLVALFLGLTIPKTWTHLCFLVSHILLLSRQCAPTRSQLSGISGIASSRWAWHDAHHRLHWISWEAWLSIVLWFAQTTQITRKTL